MELIKIMHRELYRIFLIVCSPILLPLWMSFCKTGTKKEIFFFYWQSVFRKDLNLDQYKE